MPKGLIFGLSMLDTWLWGADPAAPLMLCDTFESLRAKIGEGYFEELLREIFIDREPSILTLIPSRTLPPAASMWRETSQNNGKISRNFT